MVEEGIYAIRCKICGKVVEDYSETGEYCRACEKEKDNVREDRVHPLVSHNHK